MPETPLCMVCSEPWSAPAHLPQGHAYTPLYPPPAYADAELGAALREALATEGGIAIHREDGDQGEEFVCIRWWRRPPSEFVTTDETRALAALLTRSTDG